MYVCMNLCRIDYSNIKRETKKQYMTFIQKLFFSEQGEL